MRQNVWLGQCNEIRDKIEIEIVGISVLGTVLRCFIYTQ